MKEKPQPLIIRLYKKERKDLDKYAETHHVSRAQIMRNALKYYMSTFY